MVPTNDTMVAPLVNYSSGVSHIACSPMETMGERIRQLRDARSLTQEALGERLGVSRAAVSKWELGGTRDIRLSTFLALCREFDTTPDYLVFGPPENGRDPSGRFARRRRHTP